MSYLNVIVDISHHQKKVDFAVAKNTIRGVLMKASQGVDKVDSKFKERFADARNEGLLVGSYHFGEQASGKDQADFYLSLVGTAPDALHVLDFEEWSKNGVPQPPMTLKQARDFVSRIHEKTGRWPGLYGGSYLKEQLGSQTDPVLANCWLWIAQYGPTAKWPKQIWKTWTLWQYTGDGLGPEPHDVDGIGKNIDRDKFIGSAEELEAFWSSGGTERPGSASNLSLALEDAPMDELSSFLGKSLDSLTQAKLADATGRPWLFPDGVRHLSLAVTMPTSFTLVVSGEPKGPGSAADGGFNGLSAAAEVEDEDPNSVPGEAPSPEDVMAANFGADGRGDFPQDDPGLFAPDALAVKTIAYDINKSWAFLKACQTSTPRVRYGYGKKIKHGQVPGKDFQSVDCSGFVRELVRLSTNLGPSFPDGSVVQHDWVRKQGFEKTDWSDGDSKDGEVRIAFLAPQHAASGIGHVMLLHNGKTIESHGGTGPNSRIWKALSFSKKMSVYRLT